MKIKKIFLFYTIMIVQTLGLAWPVFAAAPTMDFTVNMSEAVNLDTGGGTPRIALDVGGNTRYATYASGTGTSALTFTYTATAGDLDLDGIAINPASVDLNSGTITDLNGNTLSSIGFTAPNTTNIKVDYPSLSMDFTNGSTGRYTLNGNVYTSLSSFLTAASGTFSRSSVGTYFDSSGTMQTALSDVPRFDYNPTTLQPRGILIEESRTNSVRNSMISGAVAASPGTAPTNWSYFTTTGVTRQIVGTGTINGMNYVDVRFNGTATAAGSLGFDPEGSTSTSAPASTGQTWTASIYVGLVGGSWPVSRTVYLGVVERNSSNTSLGSTTTDFRSLATSSSLVRVSAVRTLSNAAAAYVTPVIRSDLSIGDAVNFTMRIAAPQLEQGKFVTSFIPTTSSTVTRQADSLQITGLTSLLNSNHTAYVSYEQLVGGTSSYSPGILSIDTGSSTSRVYMYRDGSLSSKVALNARNSGSDSYVGTGYTAGAGQGAWSYTSTDVRLAQGGTYKGNVTTNIPSGLSRLMIGGGDLAINGSVKKLKIYGFAHADAQLELLTQ